MAKRKPWIRARHRVVRQILYALLHPYSRWKYGITVEKFFHQGHRPYVILYNHQTAFDQFFVGMAFREPVYYLASEDLFSNGWVSALIRWLVAPIPIKKQATDVRAVMHCLQVAREGGTIAIAPEGNRTYSGRTGYMNPAIAPLVRKLGLPVAFLRIEGGFGVQPRWSDVVRKGSMRAYVSRVLEPQEIRELSDEALCAAIRQELYVDEAVADAAFIHPRAAEYLERAMYVCPTCGLSTFESHGDTVTCKQCGLQVRYLPTKELEGVDAPFPYRYVADWYDYQCDYINRLDITAHTEKPLYREHTALYQVIINKRKVCLRKQATLSLYGDRLVIDEGTEQALRLSFDDIHTVTVLGRNKLNIYHKDTVYQCKSHKRFNALKYVNLYHRYKNIRRGDTNEQFLGL